MTDQFRCLPSIQEVKGSIPVWDSDFFLSHSLVMLMSSLFTFHYRALKLPSLFIYHTHNGYNSADPSGMQDACHI